jgi:hypothetical protein
VNQRRGEIKVNELTNDELMTLISMLKNGISDIEKVIDAFGLSPGREEVWSNRHRLLAKLQIILEDREGK